MCVGYMFVPHALGRVTVVCPLEARPRALSGPRDQPGVEAPSLAEALGGSLCFCSLSLYFCRCCENTPWEPPSLGMGERGAWGHLDA